LHTDNSRLIADTFVASEMFDVVYKAYGVMYSVSLFVGLSVSLCPPPVWARELSIE